jgi:hypothetical protein
MVNYGVVRNDFLWTYAYLGRCPRLVWVGPLTLIQITIRSITPKSSMSLWKFIVPLFA